MALDYIQELTHFTRYHLLLNSFYCPSISIRLAHIVPASFIGLLNLSPWESANKDVEPPGSSLPINLVHHPEFNYLALAPQLTIQIHLSWPITWFILQIHLSWLISLVPRSNPGLLSWPSSLRVASVHKFSLELDTTIIQSYTGQFCYFHI